MTSGEAAIEELKNHSLFSRIIQGMLLHQEVDLTRALDKAIGRSTQKASCIMCGKDKAEVCTTCANS